ncbi:unnamed protein product [Nippostrongylus brasiliensis]|uniref:AGC-kinase C-terminal domain-containing protein n=1 Tax=Nippostrongylus brasiliensis TaxID=27835 RepID=A0A0N4YXT2_NIPBR|nr:hypothetical protein Q1695_014815 [Nippostrongylus brasiliensis]VDL86610.1 unnamed protein product [Nippostrongylus brasiliensis]
MATEQSMWNTAKNFFSFSPEKASTTAAPTERKELVNHPAVGEKKLRSPVKTFNADQTYMYEFGSLNLP